MTSNAKGKQSRKQTHPPGWTKWQIEIDNFIANEGEDAAVEKWDEGNRLSQLAFQYYQ